MLDFSFYDPPIEVAAGSPRLEMIVARLKAAGLRPYVASEKLDFSVADPLLVDVDSASPQTVTHLARAAMIGMPRQIVLVNTAGAQVPRIEGAVHLRQDKDLSTLRSRLAALARRGSRQREAAIRRESAQELGARLPPVDVDAVPALLYLGDGSPFFLSLQGALRQREVELTAAFSRPTARQHMASKRFAAALIDLSMAQEDAGGMGRWISEEDGLAGLPLIVISRPQAEYTERELALLSHASEIIDPAEDDDVIVSIIETLCRRLHANAPMMPLPGLSTLKVTDLVSGLFTRGFFEAHLPRQMQVAHEQAEAFSVLTLRLDVDAAKSLPAQKAAGEVIRRLIRDTDFAALAEPGVFVISLPATPYRGGVRLAERIADGFSRAGDAAGFSWRVTERRNYHTPQTLLSTALIGPFVRARIAA
ncbi:hypothetical protein K1X12_12920 [Hyphomonas sp. WL0036]|uniref:hypothetical protein n=1 Tax=Hyphomonas sediminis TaxID=2866160 RepID=UPI001C804B3D|nr:hypothetical protein [Hyphomonas sediminis]MBY9067806.1 hypothetical protein [Hyphomonas sediminis]